MTKLDRLKEIEKLAEDLGLNQPKEVECVSCKKKIKSNEAVVITKGGNTSYLCDECYKKIEEGKLKEDTNLEEMERWKGILRGLKDNGNGTIQPAPMLPRDYPPIIPMTPSYPDGYIGTDTYPKITWKKYIDNGEWSSGTDKISYRVEVGTGDGYGYTSGSVNNMLLKFEPKK